MSHEIKREIGPFGLLFMSIAAIFGSGWLFTPFFAAQIAGPNAIISWIIGALISAVIGLTMAEVITLYPQAGGLNTIAQITHGKLIGFIMNVLMLLVCIILPVLEVRAIIQYIGSQASIIVNSKQQITLLGYLLAFFLLFLINWMIIYGAKLTAKITGFSVLFKLLPPIIIGCCFIAVLYENGTLNATNLHPFLPLHWDGVFLAISTSGIMFSFNGFNQATLFAAEAKNPSRNIPLAILGSIFCTAVFYIFVQIIFLVSLPPSALANGWSVLHYPGDSGPFIGLAVILGLHALLYLIYADAIISPLGTAFTYSSGAPRLLCPFAKNSGLMPFLDRHNKNGAPHFAVGLSFILAMIAFILLPTLKTMISILVAAFVLNYTVAPVCLLALRKQPVKDIVVFRLPFAKFFSVLSLFLSQAMVYCCGFNTLYKLLILVTTAFIIGLIFLPRSKTDALQMIEGFFWFILQLISLTFVAYLSDINAISFVSAILIIALLSIFTLIFALRSILTQQLPLSSLP